MYDTRFREDVAGFISHNCIMISVIPVFEQTTSIYFETRNDGKNAIMYTHVHIKVRLARLQGCKRLRSLCNGKCITSVVRTTHERISSISSVASHYGAGVITERLFQTRIAAFTKIAWGRDLNSVGIGLI